MGFYNTSLVIENVDVFDSNGFIFGPVVVSLCVVSVDGFRIHSGNGIIGGCITVADSIGVVNNLYGIAREMDRCPFEI